MYCRLNNASKPSPTTQPTAAPPLPRPSPTCPPTRAQYSTPSALQPITSTSELLPTPARVITASASRHKVESAHAVAYSVDLLCAFIFAHLALAEADIAAFQAALLLILGFIVGAALSDVRGKVVNAIPLRFAHLAFSAAFILALPSALTWRLLASSIGCGEGSASQSLSSASSPPSFPDPSSSCIQ